MTQLLTPTAAEVNAYREAHQCGLGTAKVQAAKHKLAEAIKALPDDDIHKPILATMLVLIPLPTL